MDTSPYAIEHLPQTTGTALVRMLSRMPPADRGTSADTVDQLIARLRARGAEGDDLLADAADTAASRDEGQEGGFLDRTTGTTVHAFMASEEGEEGEDPYTGMDLVDVSGPDWIVIRLDGRDDYRTMEEFIETVTDPAQAARLRDAIDGPGAFRRFRNAVHRIEDGRRWGDFRDDRQLGAMRALLAEHGIRPV